MTEFIVYRLVRARALSICDNALNIRIIKTETFSHNKQLNKLMGNKLYFSDQTKVKTSYLYLPGLNFSIHQCALFSANICTTAVLFISRMISP